MLGRLIERLFVQVQADLSSLSGELKQGVNTTANATNRMAKQWDVVKSQLELYEKELRQGILSQSQFMKQTNALVADMKTVGLSYRQAQKDVWGYVSQLRRAEAAQAVIANPAPLRAFTRSAGQARMQMMNLGYQLNDVGMTLATGMNPMTVLIQQGSQILQIYGGQGGVKQAFKDLSKIIFGIGKKAWPLAVIAGGLLVLQHSINDTSKTAVSFMDTTKAVFQVTGRHLMEFLKGPLSALSTAWNATLDWIASAFKTFFNNVIRGAIRLVGMVNETWKLMPYLWHDTMVAMQNIAVDVIQAIVNFFRVDLVKGIIVAANKVIQTFDFAYNAVSIIWKALPQVMMQAIGAAVNFVVKGAENMANVAIDGINKIIAGMQKLINFVGADNALEWFGLSGDLPTLKEADLSKWQMETGAAISDTMAKVGDQAAKSFNTNFMKGVQAPDKVNLSEHKGLYTNGFQELSNRVNKIFSQTRGKDYLGPVFDEIKAQAIENALKRIAKGEKDVGKAAKKAAKEVETLMDKLDKQLGKAADNLAKVFGNAFETLAKTGRFTFSSFIKDLDNLIIKSTSDLLQEELSNMFKSLAKSQGGLGGIFSNIFTALFGGGGLGLGIGKKASGGVEMPWRNFIAGEQGAELINQDGPSGARRVASAGRTRNMMNDNRAGTQVNMYIQTPDVESFKKSQSQLASRMDMFISRGRRNQ